MNENDALELAYRNGYKAGHSDGWKEAIHAVLQELDARLGNDGAGTETETKNQ